ncbi:MAG TPA: GNAT family N-acetyltransferase [Acidobacteriota bacterium]|nr:GNAT family N-acetyltransferase [Acidobacteriota bacterium]
MNVELLNESRDGECSAFLDRLGQSSPSVLGYHYPFYRDMLCHIGVGEPFYWGAWNGSQLVGLLPGFLRRAEHGLAYCSLPYFGPNAGVVCATNGYSREVHAALLTPVLDHLARQPDSVTASFYTPFLFERFDLYADLVPQAVVVPKKTLYLDLQNPTWEGKIRYDLNKARKHGLAVSEELSQGRIQALYEIYRQNCVDHGIPLKPQSAIEFLLTRGIESGRVGCYLAFESSTLVAGLIIIWGPRTVSYYLPCSTVRGRAVQAGTLLIDWVMKEAGRRGIRFWNWESSPSIDSGVYRFKSKWGSIESDYRVYVRAFTSVERLRSIGAAEIAHHYPFFFVYPFDRL